MPRPIYVIGAKHCCCKRTRCICSLSKIDSEVTVKPLKSCEKVGTSVNKKKSLKGWKQAETSVEQAHSDVAHNGW